MKSQAVLEVTVVAVVAGEVEGGEEILLLKCSTR